MTYTIYDSLAMLSKSELEDIIKFCKQLIKDIEDKDLLEEIYK
jgi:hypothetical protein